MGTFQNNARPRFGCDKEVLSCDKGEPLLFPELTNSSLSGGLPSQRSERERPVLPCTWWMGGLFSHVCHLRRWATWSPADKRTFVIAVFLGEGSHMECGHPFSVRDDHGIWGNLLQLVEPLGGEKQTPLFRFTAFLLNWQSRSYAVTSTIRWLPLLQAFPTSLLCCPPFSGPAALSSHQASVSSALRGNLFRQSWSGKGFPKFDTKSKSHKKKDKFDCIKIILQGKKQK